MDANGELMITIMSFLAQKKAGASSHLPAEDQKDQQRRKLPVLCGGTP